MRLLDAKALSASWHNTSVNVDEARLQPIWLFIDTSYTMYNLCPNFNVAFKASCPPACIKLKPMPKSAHSHTGAQGIHYANNGVDHANEERYQAILGQGPPIWYDNSSAIDNGLCADFELVGLL
ncbi:hypothetical protein CYLTODRAFT_460745 [Cylindrobasidium torrendii FP15055 ss-10]|uniref:Uncharacterized protein n=1 Tax=Cylindrobasidium torrendii FP15055 ss-10 TaxID=1314674 RepID=A0A0D7AR50_9AGAR|nr:hypothetical protein CYLTODRAFT_460745 [Cylindrobasidium torrendii FP15055 ss-10]